MADEITNSQVRNWAGSLSSGSADVALPKDLGARWTAVWKSLRRVRCDHDGSDPVWVFWLHVRLGWWRLRISR
jgi:hypothetical protein